MPRGNDLEFLTKSSASVEILKNQKTKSITQRLFSKRKKEFYAIVLLLSAILLILYFLQHENSSVKKTKKIKRHLKANEFNEVLVSKTDIEIVPENRRMNQHPNHRYADDDHYIDMNIKQQLNAKKAQHSLPRRTIGKIQDGKFKFRLAEQKAKGQNKLQNEPIKDLTSSMRLKGVYIQTKSKEGTLRNQLSEKQSYSKEINNLVQNSSMGEKEGRKWSPRKTLKSRGVPFQLPTKGRGNYERQKANQDKFQIGQIPKIQHPITIYLDFYPMNDFENSKKKLKSNSPTRKEFYNPKFGQSISPEKFHLPEDKQKRMIMKLNLYPKQRMSSYRNFSSPEHSLQSSYNKKAERKSFGWFFKSKKKKKKPKECSIMGFHPREKQITAKWKNENGEWIHAKRVTVKYLEK